MEYMESKMQDYIEAGISEADRCYTRITKLEEQNAALAATVVALRDAAQQLSFEIAHCTSPAAFNSFSGLQDAIAATPQQHLAEIKAQAGRDGWLACSERYDELIEYSVDYEKDANQYADSIRQEKK